VERVGDPGPFDVSHPHHEIRALRVEPVRPVVVRERRGTAGLTAYDRPEPFDAVHLIGSRDREANDDRAMVEAPDRSVVLRFRG
jgi:hypothetical protein